MALRALSWLPTWRPLVNQVGLNSVLPRGRTRRWHPEGHCPRAAYATLSPPNEKHGDGSKTAEPSGSDHSSSERGRDMDSWLKHRLPFRAAGLPSGREPGGRFLTMEQTQRMLRKMEKLMHDAVHLKQTDMPEPILANLREEYLQLDQDLRSQALLLLALRFNVDVPRVTDLMKRYLAVTDASSSSAEVSETLAQGGGSAPDGTGNLAVQLRLEGDLRSALTPLSVRLFEAINGQPGGLKFLVDLRSDLRKSIEASNHPALRALDRTLKGMFATWLSPACLELRQITWDDSAALLEKVVAYEAVHPVSSLFDLKRRLGDGRRCFAYFHPAIPGEPLVFIEVALTTGISSSIQDVLQDAQPVREEDASTAVFYSISNTQGGLSGIDLGNFLIKRVVRVLRLEMPGIQTFVTLSPIPGFLRWLLPKLSYQAQQAGGGEGEAARRGEGMGAFGEEQLLLAEESSAILTGLGARPGEDPHAVLLGFLAGGHEWQWREEARGALQAPLMRLCGRYLLREKQRGRALDPVTNFHVRNGACVERLNWMADTSPRGMSLSAGLMVNYLYRLDEIESNHQAYVQNGQMAASRRMLDLLQPKNQHL